MTSKKKKEKMAAKLSKPHHAAHEAEGVASGAAAGAVLGAIAGPPGMAVGAIIGGVVGGVAAAVLDNEATRAANHERKLDEDMGVSEGELGAPNLKHPPAKVGAYSSASAGGSSGSDAAPAEGPLLTPPEN